MTVSVPQATEVCTATILELEEMQKHVSDCLLEKQAQLSAAQSHTEELDADLDRLVALKRQVDKATGHEGPEGPRPGSLLPSQPQLHTSTGMACPGPGQARARRDPPSTSVVRAWPWAPGLRSSPRSQRPPSRRPHPGGGGRIEAKEPSERVLGGDRGSGETRGGAGGAAGGAAGGRRRPLGADHLRVGLAGGEGAGHPSRRQTVPEMRRLFLRPSASSVVSPESECWGWPAGLLFSLRPA